METEIAEVEDTTAKKLTPISPAKLTPVGLVPVGNLTQANRLPAGLTPVAPNGTVPVAAAVPKGLTPVSAAAVPGTLPLPPAPAAPAPAPAAAKEAPSPVSKEPVAVNGSIGDAPASSQVAAAPKLSSFLASLEPAPNPVTFTEDPASQDPSEPPSTPQTENDSGSAAVTPSEPPAPQTDISPMPMKSRIVKPEGDKGPSKIPTSNANRPKTPLRARPSSAGRLQGNASMTVSNSAAPRNAGESNSQTPSFLKETKAWKHRTLAEEELERLKTDGGVVQSSLTKSGVTIAPVSAGGKHHYEKSTVSSSTMDEKMSSRIRELRAASAGTSVHSTAPSAVPRGASASRSNTPTRQRPSSAGPRARPSAPPNPNAKPVYSRLFDSQVETARKLEQARKSKLEQEAKELTFKPTLYSTPPSNLHARGDVKAVPVSKDHSPAAVTLETARTPPTASSAARSLRGSAAATSARTPPSRGSALAPRGSTGGRPSATQTDVFDRLSKLTTASLQAENYVAPAPAPTFSGGSIVPEDHPSLAQMTSHPSFGAGRDPHPAPAVKIKYVPPAVAIPPVRSSTEKTPENSPVKKDGALRKSTSNNWSEKKSKVQSEMDRLRNSLANESAPAPAAEFAPEPSAAAPVEAPVVEAHVETPVVQGVGIEEEEDAVDAAPGEIVGVEESVLSVEPTAAEESPLDSVQHVVNHKSSGIPVRSPKYADKSPMQKMADKKAAYESLLEEVVPESETVTDSDTASVTPSALSPKALLGRQDSSGNSPINVALGSVGGAMGLNTSKHVQKMKRGVGLPKRRLSGTALSVDDLNVALNEGGGGDVDRGNRVEIESGGIVSNSIPEADNEDDSKKTKSEDEPTKNSSDREVDESNRDRLNTGSSADVDDAAKETIDRMLEGFDGKVEDLDSSV